MKQLMKPMEANPMRLLAGACSLVLTLGLAQPSVAQQVQKPQTQALPVASASSFDALAPVSFSSLLPGTPTAQAAAKPAAEEEEESPKPNSAGHQGIKVHGHWVLQVKNADGTLGERREFENSLIATSTAGQTNSGAQLMAAMLSGNVTVGDPAIGFVTGSLAGDPSTFCVPYLVSNNCSIFSSSNSLWSEQNVGEGSNGLSHTVTFTPSPSILLSGNYLVPAGLTSISGVQSLYGLCVPTSNTFTKALNIILQEGGPKLPLLTLQNSATFRNADVAPLNCAFGNSGLSTDSGILFPLTSTAVMSGTPAVPTPLTVIPGQYVNVSLVITFS